MTQPNTVHSFPAERWIVAALALAFTYLFFYEYLPPFKRVHLFADIEGYHYPLLQYAFQSFKEGRFPEWDPSIYCGLTFAGNIQAALFYPPNWLMFAANAGREHLSFKGVEGFVFLHVWLAFVLCYVWLRARPLERLPAIFGAGVFAFSGFVMSQFNHVGVISGYAWFPLGAWGIDQAVARRHWQPLWKVIAASALCFLAGFPPTWVVFCASMVVYAAFSPAHWRAVLGVLLALAASLPAIMVQLLPAREAASLMVFDPKYGLGIKDPEFFVSYFLPNYFDFGTRPFGWGFPPGQYLYVGAPALFALLWLARRWNLRAQLQALGLLAVCLIGLTNPYNIVLSVLEHSRLLVQMTHAFNFLEGVSLAVALLAAVSLDDFLKRAARPLPDWAVTAISVALLAWSVRQLWIWRSPGRDFGWGWNAAFEPAVMLALFAVAMYALRGRHCARLAAVLLLAVAVDYKVFGTSRAFDAVPGDTDRNFPRGVWPGMDNEVYREILANSVYRVAFDEGGPAPHSTDSRHFGVTTPQGFDPFIPTRFKEAIEVTTPFSTDRLFFPDPENEDLMRMLGVRYYITRAGRPAHDALLANPNFRLLEPAETFYNVFEFLRAQPPYYWDPHGGGEGPIERLVWRAEEREFRIRAERGGRLVLAEQAFPGWRATVDGRPVPIEIWNGAFQAVDLGPGEHAVRFEFGSPGLRIGAVVSVLWIAGLAALFSLRGPRKLLKWNEPNSKERWLSGRKQRFAKPS